MSTTLDPSTSATAPAARVPIIRAREAAVAAGGRVLWRGLNADIARGEFVAIIGPNGAGKTTLLNALLGTIPTVAGSIEMLDSAGSSKRPCVGYLPQRHAFDPATRIRGIDLVRLGIDGTRWGTPIPGLSRLLTPERHRRAEQRLAHAIDVVGAAGFARQPIGECSGGQQQRLLIAQTLVSDPEIVLLDEPLDALDVPSQSGVAALLRSISNDHGITVIAVIHDVNPLLSYLDRIITISNGTAQSGTPDEVITADRLTEIYGTPIDVLTDRRGRRIVVGLPHADPGRVVAPGPVL